MDETTLTRTLRSLAADPPLHTAPAADARHRAHRLQRSRRTGAAGLAVIAIAAIVLVARPLAGSTTSGGTVPTGLTDPNNPYRPTTAVVMVDRGQQLKYAIYWHDTSLCEALVDNGQEGGSHCAPGLDRPDPVAINRLDSPDYSFVSITGAVSKVVARLANGSAEALPIVDGEGWPARVATVPGPVVDVRAYDAIGTQLGTPAFGDSGLLTIRPVTSEAPCDPAVPMVAGELKDRAGTFCYLLDPIALTIHPKSVAAVHDDTQGYLVQVNLDDTDTRAFGVLTAKVTTLTEPMNQLAIVLDGVVLSAPAIQSAIDGGTFQITGGQGTAYTKVDVDKLVTELSE